MEDSKYIDLMLQHGIKPSANRIVITKELATCGRPMSLSELEYKILTIDKSGIFRTLTNFKEHHMVHVIEDGGDGVRYELCMSHADDDDDMHAHFYCECCQKTFCLDNTPIPNIPLPEGYKMTSVNYMVKGLCDECSKRQQH